MKIRFDCGRKMAPFTALHYCTVDSVNYLDSRLGIQITILENEFLQSTRNLLQFLKLKLFLKK